MAYTTRRAATKSMALLSSTKRFTQTQAGPPVVTRRSALGHGYLTSSPLSHTAIRLGSSLLKAQARSFTSFVPSSSESQEGVQEAKKGGFTYALAAAYTAKDVPFNPIRNTSTFQPSAFVPANPAVPHRRLPRSQRPASGQDAYFISKHENASISYAFGVADGVGGWADSGVDPADFSHAFCENMGAAYSGQKGSKYSAKSLMQNGYNSVLEDNTIKAGGSTALVAIASPDGKIELANLGDSGFLHIRTGAIRYASEAQIHAFNTPYQLAVIPESMRKRQMAFGGQQLADLPRDSNVTRIEVKEGDVVVLATDGVWDNLTSSDVLKIAGKIMEAAGAWKHNDSGIEVTPALKELTTVEIEDVNKEAVEAGEFDGKVGGRHHGEGIKGLQGYLAAAIAGEAKAASDNTKRDGPFAREVQKYYPEEMWRGGKVDDICVVVAIAVGEK